MSLFSPAYVTFWPTVRHFLALWWGGNDSFVLLWVWGDGRRSSSCTRETPHQLLTSLHRDLQANRDTFDRITGGRKWANIHRWLDVNLHSNWHSNPTDVGNRSIIAIQVWQFIATIWFLIVMMFLADEGLVFAGSLHALCSYYIDPLEGLHLAENIPMYRRRLALVARLSPR